METENVAAEYKKTEEELRELAIDIVSCRVTTDRHCQSREYFFQLFLTISFKDNYELCKSFEKVTVYEYNYNAGPSGSFLSFKLVVNEDVVRLWDLVAKLTTSMEEVFHPSQPDSNNTLEPSVSP